MGNLLFLLLATVSAVYIGFIFSRGRQKRFSVPLVVMLVLVIVYGGWQVSQEPNAPFESSEIPGGQTGERAKKQLSVPKDLNPVGSDDIPSDNLINTLVSEPPSVPTDLNRANPEVPSDGLIDPVATKQLSVPTGINPSSPDDLPSDNLINTGDLEAFLKSVSSDGHTQILQDAELWAEIWTYNTPVVTFSKDDVLSLLNQLAEPLPLEQVDALVANAILASKN